MCCFLLFLWWAILNEVYPLCWCLDLYFCFVCCLDKASCTGCYWFLGDAGSCIQVVSSVCVLTIWYSLELVLWKSRILEPVFPLQRLKASGFHKWFVMALSEIKTNTTKWKTKDELQTNGSYKIRQIIIKIMEYTHIHIHPWEKSKQSNQNKIQ